MRHAARILGVVAVVIAAMATLSGLAFAQSTPNAVVQWNETTMNVIDANGQNPVQSTRTLAMVHGAVHDALNAINRRNAAYNFVGSGESGASPDAAVAAAAHTVLVGIIGSFGTPAQKGAALALVEQAYAASLAKVSDGPARNKGVMVGRAAGAAMLTARKGGRGPRGGPCPPGTGPRHGRAAPHAADRGPGEGRPHPNPPPPTPPIANPDAARGYSPSVLPGWGNVTPFTLLSSSQYWLPGPPALTSTTYTRDFNEIKAVGG